MMMPSLCALIIVVTFSLYNTNNPVKAVMKLMILSILMFTALMIMLGKVWLPSIMTMLFLGGVLIMILILSSLMPNSLEKKSSNRMYLVGSLVFLTCLSTPRTMLEISPSSGKWVLTEKTSFTFLALMMTIYFFFIISILSSEVTPMRSM